MRFWKLAKVEEPIPSRDNVVRAARIRVINNENGRSTYLRRPVQHLIPLELHSTPAQEAQVPQVPWRILDSWFSRKGKTGDLEEMPL